LWLDGISLLDWRKYQSYLTQKAIKNGEVGSKNNLLALLANSSINNATQFTEKVKYWASPYSRMGLNYGLLGAF